MKYSNVKEDWDWSTDEARCDHDLAEKYQKAIDAAWEEVENAKKEYNRMKMKFDKELQRDRKERESEKKRAKEMWEMASKDDEVEQMKPEEKVEQKPEEKVEQKPDNEKKDEQKPDESMLMSVTMPASMGGATQYFSLENANNVTVNIEERQKDAGKDA